MMNYFKLAFLGFVVLSFISCGKNDVVKKIEKKIEIENAGDEIDTVELTPQEEFSSALVSDILDVYDEELQIYLEEEIYPIASKSNKITIDKISSSLYLLQYEENGNSKNLLIQKFYNPIKKDFFFDKREVQNDAIRQFLK